MESLAEVLFNWGAWLFDAFLGTLLVGKRRGSTTNENGDSKPDTNHFASPKLPQF